LFFCHVTADRLCGPTPAAHAGEQLGQRAGHSVSAGRMTSLQWLTRPVAGSPSAGAKRATTRVARRTAAGCWLQVPGRLATVTGGLWFNASPFIRTVVAPSIPRHTPARPTTVEVRWDRVTGMERGEAGRLVWAGVNSGYAGEGLRVPDTVESGSVGSGAPETSSSSEGEPCSRKRNDWRSHSF
jgi:hypothetical protein